MPLEYVAEGIAEGESGSDKRRDKQKLRVGGVEQVGTVEVQRD